MDDYLFELGISDVKIKVKNQEEPLSQEQMKVLLRDHFRSRKCLLLALNAKGFFPRLYERYKCSRDACRASKLNLIDGSRFAYSQDEFEALEKSR